VNLDNTLFPVIIRPLASGYNIRYERHKISIKSNWVLGSAIFRGTVNHKAVSVKIEISAGGSYKLTYGGRTVTATVRTPRIAELEKFMPLKDNNQDSNQVSAPMGGRVVNIKAKVGDEIGIGQELLTIEAMKMENSICSEQKAKIAHIHVGQGDNVNFGQVLVEFE
jgi:propionyl-CoA carboxylase alpha chain